MQIMVRILVIFLLFVVTPGFRPADKPGKLNWLSLADAEQAANETSKPILIDLYTDWCGWCKVMDRKTYSNKKVIAYLNDRYYTVKVNAESKTPFVWSGRTFSFNPHYKTNDFAFYLTQGRLSYPTTVILPADGSAPVAVPGYLSPRELEIFVRYYGDGHYGKKTFQEYRHTFISTW